MPRPSRSLAIIQARMASTRLPGKVLLDIAGRPMLQQVLLRCQKAHTLDGIVVATTTDASDDPVERFCAQQGYPCYRGSPQDVLDRYYQAARYNGADLIVRITGDCPVIDPEVIDHMVQVFAQEPEPAFAATRLPPPWHRTIPIGLDVEVVSFTSLEQAWKAADQPFHREHVMPYFYEGTPPGILKQPTSPELAHVPGTEWSVARGISTRGFHVAVLNHFPDYGAMRWTVDTPEDLALIRMVFAAFPGSDSFTWKDILALFQQNPDLGEVNAAVRHKDFRESEIRTEIIPGEAGQVTETVLTETAMAEMTQPKPSTVSLCPLCGKSHSRLFDQRVFRGIQVTNRICATCGFVFQSPRMSESELQDFYAAEYRRLYQGSEAPVAKDLAVQTKRAKALLAFLQPYLGAQAQAAAHEQTPAGFCYLDIGCSAGKLLETIGQAFGCQVVGVEPGDAYRQEVQRRGLEVYASLEEVAQAGPRRFELISMIHVLEHLPDPVRYLSHLRQAMLQPGGWLLLEVPNLYAHDCFEIAHLASYSAHTLAQVLKLAGFEIIVLKKHGAPRSRVLPLYLTLLARPSPNLQQQQTVSPDRFVGFKRRLGMIRRRFLSRVFPSLAWLS